MNQASTATSPRPPAAARQAVADRLGRSGRRNEE